MSPNREFRDTTPLGRTNLINQPGNNLSEFRHRRRALQFSEPDTSPFRENVILELDAGNGVDLSEQLPSNSLVVEGVIGGMGEPERQLLRLAGTDATAVIRPSNSSLNSP